MVCDQNRKVGHILCRSRAVNSDHESQSIASDLKQGEVTLKTVPLPGGVAEHESRTSVNTIVQVGIVLKGEFES